MQACAKQILGRMDVEFPSFLKEACKGRFKYLLSQKRGRGAATPGRRHRWKHENGFKQWWCDAFTVDPSHMMGGEGLWEHGQPQVVTSTALENASVGSLPSVMVYLVAHPTHGTHAFYPYHGAKHGAVKGNGQKTLFKDFEYWYSSLPAEVLAQIVELNYFNHPKSVEAFFNKAKQEEVHAFRTGPFNPKYFLVCPHSGCMHQLEAHSTCHYHLYNYFKN